MARLAVEPLEALARYQGEPALAAKVETGTRKALLVPKGFIVTRFGIDYVTVLSKDGSATQVPVQTAPSPDTGKVELLSGVAVGDTLIGPAQ